MTNDTETLFTYSERCTYAAQSFIDLQGAGAWDLVYLRQFVSNEWSIKPRDLDVKLWDIRNK